MGGVFSVSGKKSTSPSGEVLLLLAMEKQQGFVNAQKDYDASILFCATAFKEFVDRHCSSDSVKLQDAVHDDQENEEEHHDNNESSLVIEKPQPQPKPHNKKENSGTAKGRPRSGTNGKAAGMVAEKAEAIVAEKAESSGNKEDTKVAPEKRLADFVVQFKKVSESGSGICELLETKSETLVRIRSSASNRSTRSKKIYARSRSSRVSDQNPCGEKDPKDYSILYRLYVKEKSFSIDLKRVEDESVKNCDSLEIQDAVDRAQEAFNKIKKLSDDQLQPLLLNLLKSLHGSWKIMSDCHDKQHEIMAENSCYKPRELCCDADNLIATDRLQTELKNWHNAFTSYILSQKSYIESLYNWSRKGCSSLLKKGENDNGGTTLQTTLLGNWSKLKILDDKEVTRVGNAMIEFEKEVKKLRDQENTELEWKSKVNALNETIRKLVNKNKETRKEKKDEELNELKKNKKKNRKTKQEKKDEELNELKKKLKNAEKAYQDSQTATQKMVTNVFQERFASLFKSLSVFTKNAAKEYAEIARDHSIEVLS